MESRVGPQGYVICRARDGYRQHAAERRDRATERRALYQHPAKPPDLSRRHGDTATIARKKSAIFLGMEAGGVAVLNRDMLEFPIVREAAVARGVRVLTYGTSDEADLRLLSHDGETGRVAARLQEREVEWSIGSGGVHTALNSLAVAGGVIALGLPLEPLIGALDSFVALPGRGQVVDVEFRGRGITIIDDAYNANPGSMAAALTRLSALAMGRRTVAVLGQMAELGPGGRATTPT